MRRRRPPPLAGTRYLLGAGTAAAAAAAPIRLLLANGAVGEELSNRGACVTTTGAPLLPTTSPTP